MLTVLINAVVLYALISKFAPDDNPVGSRRILAITVAALIVQIALSLVSKQPVWLFLAILAPAAVVWAALAIWCRLPRSTALKIAALSTAANLAISTAIFFASRALFRSLN